jgi:hypothetical protein
MQEEEQLTELECNRTLKMKFNEVPPDVFWISIRKEYPVTSAKAVKNLFVFSFLSLCTIFSCLASIKSKDRNPLLSVEENCKYVCQKFGQEFNICAKRNKFKYHIKSKLYSDFGYQQHFDV